jgi:hypothetical protein
LGIPGCLLVVCLLLVFLPVCFVHNFENSEPSPKWIEFNSSSVYLTLPMEPVWTSKKESVIKAL